MPLKLQFDVITVFPDLFVPFLRTSLLGRAIEAGTLEAGVTNPSVDRPLGVDVPAKRPPGDSHPEIAEADRAARWWRVRDNTARVLRTCQSRLGEPLDHKAVLGLLAAEVDLGGRVLRAETAKEATPWM